MTLGNSFPPGCPVPSQVICVLYLTDLSTDWNLFLSVSSFRSQYQDVANEFARSNLSCSCQCSADQVCAGLTPPQANASGTMNQSPVCQSVQRHEVALSSGAVAGALCDIPGMFRPTRETSAASCDAE